MSVFLHFLIRLFPELKQDLNKAHIQKKPEIYLKGMANMALMIAAVLSIIVFFFFGKMVHSQFTLLLVDLFILFPVFFLIGLAYLVNLPKVYIRKREREINKEVLFAGRYLLVKLEAGEPLFNSLDDASKSYGIAGKYFGEIVDEIRVGKPIEDSLIKARESSPSAYFKMILSEIITSLKTGVDVSTPLRAILRQITKEQMNEIKEYSKKLNAFIMLYMVIATVLPSLGMTIFIIIGGFMGFTLNTSFILSTLLIFSFMQYMFIASLKSIRPMVNI